MAETLSPYVRSHPAATRAPATSVRRPFAHVPPSWFSAVMGTGIVATAASSLPVQVPGQGGFAVAVWLLAVVLLVGTLAATAAHWSLHPDRARAHLTDPVLGHFYGAPPMALLTVGAGTLMVGHEVIGMRAAVAVDVTLWSLGTALGLVTSVVVPVVAHRRGTYRAHAAFGGWLMPVVAPMVSATTGAMLLPHVRSGSHREAMLVACYTMFAASLAASAPFVVLVGRRLRRSGAPRTTAVPGSAMPGPAAPRSAAPRSAAPRSSAPGSAVPVPAAVVPTLWIVLGPLGQSATAANLLGSAPGAHLHARHAFGIAYGVVAMTAAIGWLVRVVRVTVRAAADHLPFSLSWWGFTFPVGTCVTGAGALAAGMSAAPVAAPVAGLLSAPVAALSVALFVVLLVAWATVLVRTAHAMPTLLARPPAHD